MKTRLLVENKSIR